MRTVLFFFLSCLLYSSVTGQGSFGSNTNRMIPMTSLGSTPVKDDIQARFLNQEWSPGVVSFRNSPERWHVPVIFDIYSNKLYFLRDKQILEFADTVYE